MNNKQRKTLKAILSDSRTSEIPWRDIESLLVALGATIKQGQGSRVRVELRGCQAVFHRPHPTPSAAKGLVRALKQFLQQAGVEE